MSGRTAVFHTAIAVLCREQAFSANAIVPVTVRFRVLGDTEIERYLRAEQPYDCAGSAKCETLGIALLEAIESDDPTALVGLPLIKTCELLRRAGIDPLGPDRLDIGPLGNCGTGIDANGIDPDSSVPQA